MQSCAAWATQWPAEAGSATTVAFTTGSRSRESAAPWEITITAARSRVANETRPPRVERVLRPARREPLGDDGPVPQRIQHPAHRENGVATIPPALQARRIVEHRHPPFAQHVRRGLTHMVGVHRVDQRLWVWSRQHHAMLAQEGTVNDPVAALLVHDGQLARAAIDVGLRGGPWVMMADRVPGDVRTLELQAPLRFGGGESRMQRLQR